MGSRRPPSDALAAWLPRQRWFAAKTRRIVGVDVVDRIALAGGIIAVVRVGLDDGTTDRYAVPLAAGHGDEVRDALDDPAFCRALLALVAGGGRAGGDGGEGARGGGEVRGERTSAFPADIGVGTVAVRRLGGEQSNTSVAFDDALIMKVFRRLADGVNPEQEITRFLTERTAFRGTPPVAGVLEYRAPDGGVASLAVVQQFVPDARDGWSWMLDELAGFYARTAAAGGAPDAATVVRLAAPSLAALRRLGEVTAALHRALASDASDPAVAPEPITAGDLVRWADQVSAQLEAARRAVGAALVVDVPDLATAFGGLRGRVRIRHHGDFHLGQTLRVGPLGQTPGVGTDFVIIDFEGEPLRPLAERRAKHAALRDVAGMLRSLDYAAATAAGARAEWAAAWEAAATAEFVAAYRAAAGAPPFLPASDEDLRRALAVFELEKAAYEVVYEANHRPDWIAIPRRGLLRAASRLRRAAAGAA